LFLPLLYLLFKLFSVDATSADSQLWSFAFGIGGPLLSATALAYKWRKNIVFWWNRSPMIISVKSRASGLLRRLRNLFY
jgi:hypothetical protein